MNKKWIVAGSAFVLASCGTFETEDKGKKIEENAPEIAGEWQSNCVGADALELTHTQRSYNFSALGDFDKTERFYDDDTCSASGFTYKVVGTYADLGAHPENGDIKKINFTIDRALVTVNSENAVDILNAASLCGKDDWAVDAETDVTGKDCAGFSVEKGDVVFDVYDKRDDNLYFGQKFFFLSDDDADSRPKSVDTEVVYSRQ